MTRRHMVFPAVCNVERVSTLVQAGEGLMGSCSKGHCCFKKKAFVTRTHI